MGVKKGFGNTILNGSKMQSIQKACPHFTGPISKYKYEDLKYCRKIFLLLMECILHETRGLSIVSVVNSWKYPMIIMIIISIMMASFQQDIFKRGENN